MSDEIQWADPKLVNTAQVDVESALHSNLSVPMATINPMKSKQQMDDAQAYADIYDNPPEEVHVHDHCLSGISRTNHN